MGREDDLKPDLLRVLAHDLRNPLATLAINLDYLREMLGASVPDGARDALDDCVMATERAARLVTEMSNAARQAAAEPASPSEPRRHR